MGQNYDHSNKDSLNVCILPFHQLLLCEVTQKTNSSSVKQVKPSNLLHWGAGGISTAGADKHHCRVVERDVLVLGVN